MSRRLLPPASALLALLLAAPSVARAWDAELETAVQSLATSNVFVDRSGEGDLMIRPLAELRLDFADYWSSGASSQLTVFAQHPELLSHQHELFVFANPVWGEDEQNELVIEARLATLANREQYAALNLLRPVLLVRAGLEPRAFFRWEAEAEVSYRWFYNDAAIDSLDALAEGRLIFMLPSRTTLIARIGYGVRGFVNRQSAVDDDLDQQLDLGARIGQGLWRGAGLQLDYRHRWAFGPSGLLLRKVTEATFQYLGEDFVTSGQQGQVALKQLFGKGWTVRIALAIEDRLFPGWPAFAASGALAGADRRDLRLVPSASISYRWSRPEGRLLSAGRVVAEFTHIQQWSNSDWYESAAEVGGLEVVLAW